jgi:hypothetical protein
VALLRLLSPPRKRLGVAGVIASPIESFSPTRVIPGFVVLSARLLVILFIKLATQISRRKLLSTCSIVRFDKIIEFLWSIHGMCPFVLVEVFLVSQVSRIAAMPTSARESSDPLVYSLTGPERKVIRLKRIRLSACQRGAEATFSRDRCERKDVHHVIPFLPQLRDDQTHPHQTKETA